MLSTAYGVTVFHHGVGAGRYPTHEIWQHYLGTPVPEREQWLSVLDDFLAQYAVSGTNSAVVQQWHYWGGTGSSVDASTNVIGGIVRLNVSATANNTAGLTLRSSRITAVPTAKNICFEARISTADLEGSQRAIVGLFDAAFISSGVELMADTSLAVTTSQQSMLALAINGHATAPTLDLEFCRSGVAVYKWASLATLPKGYVKVGFSYNPSRPTEPVLSVYVDSKPVLQATKAVVESTVGNALPQAPLTPVLGMKTAAAAVGRLIVDWVACAAR